VTKHNAIWSEELYYGQDNTISEEEDVDPRGSSHGKSGYWDYRDE